MTKRKKSTIEYNRIREVLREKEMTQQELADISLDGQTGYLSNIINGHRKAISLPNAIKIARALGVTVEELFIVK